MSGLLEHIAFAVFYAFGQIWVILVLLKGDPGTRIWMQVVYLGEWRRNKGKEKNSWKGGLINESLLWAFEAQSYLVPSGRPVEKYLDISFREGKELENLCYFVRVISEPLVFLLVFSMFSLTELRPMPRKRARPAEETLKVYAIVT